MAWLKVYQWEHDTYPVFQEVKLDRHQQHLYLRKLSRHFKVPCPEIRQSYRSGVASGEGGGSYTPHYHRPVIRVGKITTMGTLCHEFAHHLHFVEHSRVSNLNIKMWHGKEFKRRLKRVYTWAKRWI